ncbi:GGDEF domain-containing protein [Wenzhouxiangella sp. AB-CW3]|uniref:GGDEF domain-containing protein n=1 Tax=Wenzhouxiangella sp. AB-CW3 TaxID=2771012 RepID=UPI00168A9C6A|nr:GGDEF domain-containing protein [Wenzhouxiangella sp. AB-CW3]QOC22477.1 GGDEF domain-containing protein [Wenzhouxiangella sp. AB-CW3]
MLPKRPELNQQQSLALATYHQQLARQMLIAASGLVILVVPAYQLQEFFLIGAVPEHWAAHAAWRSLPLLVAVFALAWCSIRGDAHGAPVLLRLLALAVMSMMFGLFAVHWMNDGTQVDRMLRGIIISTFAVTLFSLKGWRELLVFFGLPFVALLAMLQARGYPALEVMTVMFDPLMMFLIAAIGAELLYRTWLDAFLANQKLAEHAATDPLTGLSNRRHIKPQLHSETARARRHGTPYSILMADLDHFKTVNDRYGHAVGDLVLQETARRMRAVVRTEDRIARWGGEEFLILLTECDADQAAIAAEKIRQYMADEPFQCDGHAIPVTISIGVAQHEGAQEPDEVIERADQALYQAKQDGRNRVCRAPAIRPAAPVTGAA